MLSRTADHLFWMARYMERAGQPALAGCGVAGTAQHTRQRAAGFSALGVEDAI
ncbi:hypothetical protein AAW51_1706 [Caldimonas brevitalea]|uniref:DUF403 domain-containing protein n=1 Tax=Caldimonas brevitalea TaxID=413882 RepID=A0A0G3BGG1_9BURK|nr:hypothetical protein AAW51_1706 [Caldimonas brevitalea]